jgi:hypothetical protein
LQIGPWRTLQSRDWAVSSSIKRLGHLGLRTGSVWVGDGSSGIPDPATLSGMGLEALDPCPSNIGAQYRTGREEVRTEAVSPRTETRKEPNRTAMEEVRTVFVV